MTTCASDASIQEGMHVQEAAKCKKGRDTKGAADAVAKAHTEHAGFCRVLGAIASHASG